MLDADDVADYEAWKQHKLTTSVDLSVGAYNVEQEAAALAYEAGIRAAVPATDANRIEILFEANPYRSKGSTGYRPTKRKLS